MGAQPRNPHPPADRPLSSMDFGMGTVMTHTAYGESAPAALAAIAVEATRLERMLSRFLPESEVSKINRRAGLGCERVSADTYRVLERALEVSVLSDGRFDVTIGPLLQLWDFRHAATSPAASDVWRALDLVDYRDLILDPQAMSAGLRRSGQAIDLGGVGKGFAGDAFIALCRQFGVSSAFTNIGGNVVALGSKPDGNPWRVGIRHPRNEDGLVGAVAVRDQAVVTSGDYQSYFVDELGRRRHHLLDPTTGYPAEAGLASVSVVASSAMTADALSTALFVAGRERGTEIIKALPGVEAVFVTADLAVHVTSGLVDAFEAAGELRPRVV